jgi:GDP-L-fucose synthase
MSKILVTGANGLLGSEIVKLNSNSIGVNSKDCDLTKNSAFDYLKDKILKNNIEIVIHCAARVGGVKANTDYVCDFFNENILMNLNVMNACKEANVKLVSILSTCIYPDKDYVKYPLTEDQLHVGPPHFSNFGYAYAKRMLDVQTKAYRQQYNCNFITVIPNNLYGIEDNYDLELGHVIPALIRRFYEAKISRSKSVIVWGSGRPIREFTYAKDAAKIISWLARNYNEESPVNIGNQEFISIKELATLISEEIKYEGEIIFDSSKPEGQYEKSSSNKKLFSMGWNDKYTPLSVGLKETIDHFIVKYPKIRGI